MTPDEIRTQFLMPGEEGKFGDFRIAQILVEIAAQLSEMNELFREAGPLNVGRQTTSGPRSLYRDYLDRKMIRRDQEREEEERRKDLRQGSKAWK